LQTTGECIRKYLLGWSFRLFAVAPLLSPKLLLRAFLFYLLNEIANSLPRHKHFIKYLSDKTQRKDKFAGPHKFGEKKERKKLNRIRKNYKDGLKSLWQLDRMRWELNEQHN